MSVHLETPTQYLDDSRRIGPSQIDDPNRRPSLEVQPPSRGEGTPPRGRLDPVGSVAAQGSDIPLRSPLQAQQRCVLEAGPDLRLPGTIVALDRRLEAEFTRHDEHRD